MKIYAFCIIICTLIKACNFYIGTYIYKHTHCGGSHFVKSNNSCYISAECESHYMGYQVSENIFLADINKICHKSMKMGNFRLIFKNGDL